jgi:hypothetical protein
MRKEQLINQVSFLKALELMESLPPVVNEEVVRKVFEQFFVTLKNKSHHHKCQARKKLFRQEMASTG